MLIKNPKLLRDKHSFLHTSPAPCHIAGNFTKSPFPFRAFSEAVSMNFSATWPSDFSLPKGSGRQKEKWLGMPNESAFQLYT